MNPNLDDFPPQSDTEFEDFLDEMHARADVERDEEEANRCYIERFIAKQEQQDESVPF